MSPESIIFPILFLCVVFVVTCFGFLYQTKMDLDMSWQEFNVELEASSIMRDAIWRDLKSLTEEKKIVVVKRQASTYYEKVADAYAQPSSLGVEARPPSISPECNCNLQNNCPAGPPGPKGKPGLDGPIGSDGAPGQPGHLAADVQTMHHDPGCQYCPVGEMGAPGTPGHQGPRGPRGQNGAPGSPGHNGMPGRNGEQGAAGPEGPQGVPGVLGRRGMDSVREKGVRGPPGPKGHSGSAGVQGERGNRGAFGADGLLGSVGIPGEPGRQGPEGVPGEEGEPGIQGQDALYCPCPKRVPSDQGGVYKPYKS